jgi:hypothetical protein
VWVVVQRLGEQVNSDKKPRYETFLLLCLMFLLRCAWQVRHKPSFILRQRAIHVHGWRTRSTQGMDKGSQNVALITMPTGGIGAQVYVQATGVNISDITVDGSNSGATAYGEGPYGVSGSQHNATGSGTTADPGQLTPRGLTKLVSHWSRTRLLRSQQRRTVVTTRVERHH